MILFFTHVGYVYRTDGGVVKRGRQCRPPNTAALSNTQSSGYTPTVRGKNGLE